MSDFAIAVLASACGFGLGFGVYRLGAFLLDWAGGKGKATGGRGA